MKHSTIDLTITCTAIRYTKHRAKLFFTTCAVLFFGMLLTQAISVWSAESNDSNEQLLHQFIQAKGTDIIVFDSSNIKQFWIDHSVISRDRSFEVLLDEKDSQKESVPLKIQLANINADQDCKIEVITKARDFDFSVLNNSLKVISTSSSEENFLQYNVMSSVIHLDDTTNLSFYMRFSSKTAQGISINKIVLSFSKNPNFLVTPGSMKITERDLIGGEIRISNSADGSFSISGKTIEVSSIKKILVSDKPVSNNITVKNIGSKPVNVYFGYSPYTANGQRIHNRNNPYKNNNQVLNVIASAANSNKIVVDSYPDWEKGCYLVLNTKEDLSDFPNFNFIDGTIAEVKKIDEAHTEVILDRSLKSEIKKGTKVRIQSKYGYAHLYTNIQRMNPNEEVTFSSTIMKDESFLQYSPKAFCHGTYYIVPIISLNSDDSNETNIIQISNYTISY